MNKLRLNNLRKLHINNKIKILSSVSIVRYLVYDKNSRQNKKRICGPLTTLLFYRQRMRRQSMHRQRIMAANFITLDSFILVLLIFYFYSNEKSFIYLICFIKEFK